MDDLIEIVREYNVIYDTRHRQYKDNSIRTAVWEEIGQKLKQPAEKCKDDWEKLRNVYTNAIKRRKNKKSGQAVNNTPWKYEEQMSFLKPFLRTRPSITNLMSPPETPEPPELEVHSHDDYQSGDCPETPNSGVSSHPQTSVKKTNLEDLHDIMKSAHEFRVQKHLSKQQGMDETDLFFLSMSKALKRLPKLDQNKIKLDLHSAISQAEIRILERQEQITTPVNVAQQITTQPQQEFQQLAQPSTSTITMFTASSPTTEQTVSTLYSFGQENISSYYSNADFTDDTE